MNETFGVELDLKIDNFKKNSDKAKAISDRMHKRLESNSKASFSMQGLDTAGLGTNQFRRTDGTIADLVPRVTELDNGLKDAANNGNKMGSEIEKGANKSKISISKLGMALIGVRTVWSLITRARSEYLATDDKARASSEVTANVMSNILAPAVRAVNNVLQYGVIWLAKIIQFFTGFNALANVTTKSIAKTTSAAKTLNKQLAGFDEITNINQQNGSLAGGINNDLAALDEFNKKVAKVDELFKKFTESDVGKFLKDVIDGFNELSTPMKFLVGAGGLLLLNNLFGGGKGLTGILGGLGGAIGTLGLVTLAAVTIPKAKEAVKEMNKAVKETTESYTDLNKTIAHGTVVQSTIVSKYKEMQKEGTLTEEKMNALIVSIGQTNNGWANQIKMLGENKGLFNSLNGVWGKSIETIKELTEEAKLSTDSFYWFYKQGELTDYQLSQLNATTGYEIAALKEANSLLNEKSKEYIANEKRLVELNERLKVTIPEEIEFLKIANSNLKENSKEWTTNNDKIKELESKLKDLPKTTLATVEVNANTKAAEKEVNNWLTKLSKIPIVGGAFASLISGITGKGYANGLDFVPTEGYYHLHPGETVVPAGFTPEMHGLGGNNAAVLEAIENLTEVLRNKDMNAYIGEKEVGQASTNWINTQSRIIGESVIKI